jgi:hypothetical protein
MEDWFCLQELLLPPEVTRFQVCRGKDRSLPEMLISLALLIDCLESIGRLGTHHMFYMELPARV